MLVEIKLVKICKFLQIEHNQSSTPIFSNPKIDNTTKSTGYLSEAASKYSYHVKSHTLKAWLPNYIFISCFNFSRGYSLSSLIPSLSSSLSK